MASWMVHLRIADKLPDSGVPNEDWSAFSPPTKISHFKTGTQKAGPEAFSEKYFKEAQRNSYSTSQYGFYLGYLTHLITDQLWSEQIALPTFRNHIGGDPPYRGPKVWEIKEDWYDLDFKYLRNHPGFRAFRVYLGAVGFRNNFMEEFSPDAFDNRRQYITGFYLQGKDGLDREYPYLTETEMDGFVIRSVHTILDRLHTNYAVKL